MQYLVNNYIIFLLFFILFIYLHKNIDYYQIIIKVKLFLNLLEI